MIVTMRPSSIEALSHHVLKLVVVVVVVVVAVVVVVVVVVVVACSCCVVGVTKEINLVCFLRQCMLQ